MYLLTCTRKGFHYFDILFAELILKENGEPSTNRHLEINNLWDILAFYVQLQYIQDFANKQIYSVNQWEGCPQSWVKLQNRWAIRRTWHVLKLSYQLRFWPPVLYAIGMFLKKISFSLTVAFSECIVGGRYCQIFH